MLSADLRKKIIDLHNSGISLGVISKQLQQLLIQINGYKFGSQCTTTYNHVIESHVGERPSVDSKLVQMLRNN